MDINELTIGQARQLATMFPPAVPVGAAWPVKSDGRPVIVRSRDAGVQFGYLDRFEGSTVYLTNARQMWSWHAAKGGTLLDCATFGVKPDKCKFSAVNAAVVVIGACAIIDCTPEAVKTLEAAKWE